jgi:hypothetical protein
MGPRVKDHNPLGTQKIVSLMFEKEYVHLGSSRKLKISKPNTIFYLIAGTMAEISLKQRKTINQSRIFGNKLSGPGGGVTSKANS